MRNMRFDSQSGLATGTRAGTRNKPVHVVRRMDTQHSYEDRGLARLSSLPAPHSKMANLTNEILSLRLGFLVILRVFVVAQPSPRRREDTNIYSRGDHERK